MGSSSHKSSITRKDFFKIFGGMVGASAISYYLGLQSQVKGDQSGAEMPDYADASLAYPSFRGPHLQKDVQMAVFLFAADVAMLAEQCNQTLNAARGSPYEYVPLMHNVMVVYADMLVSSLDERDAQVGLIPETEVGFWMLTVAMQKTPAGNLPHHLAWFIPYLFVDEGSAIATGREVYGFNKQAGMFSKAEEIQAPRFSADVLGFQRFGPGAIARKERLLDVSALTPQSSQEQWEDWSSAQNALIDLILSKTRLALGDDMATFAARALLQPVPIALLKQFRHAGNTRKAAYQAVVETQIQIESFQGGGSFSQPYEMRLHHLDSHPLAQKLGLQETQTSKAAAWLKVDFSLTKGTEFRSS